VLPLDGVSSGCCSGEGGGSGGRVGWRDLSERRMSRIVGRSFGSWLQHDSTSFTSEGGIRAALNSDDDNDDDDDDAGGGGGAGG